MTRLDHKVREYQTVREKLLSEYPDLVTDDQALADTLEGCTSLPDALCGIMRSADDDEMQVAAIKARIDELEARKKRLETRVSTKRHAVECAMSEAGLKRLPMADMTVTLRKTPPKVQITDEAEIPRHYIATKVTERPDLKAIKAALDAGHDVPGAMLTNGGESLSVRRG